MNRPSTIDDRLTAWLDEGPSSGPDDLLTAAHARARSMRQRPAWLLALKGETMDTTWRARPVLMTRLAFVLLTVLLVIALTATTLVVGSRLTALIPNDSDLAVAPVIPQGADALLAFTSWYSDDAAGDLFVVRADGMDGRHVTSDALDDWSPAWSPDGGEIAVYSQDEDSIQLRVIGADGAIRILDDSRGCFNSSQAPAWSPDSRFLLYSVDRQPYDGICDLVYTDVFVVPSDGSAPGRRLMAADHKEFTTYPAWSGDRILVAGNRGGEGGLWVADVTDPNQPWDLSPRRIDDLPANEISFGWSRWSPDGTGIATTLIPHGGYGDAVAYQLDRAAAQPLLPDDISADKVWPEWGPDGTRLTMLVLTEQLADHGVYRLVVVGADGSDPRTITTPDLNANGGPAMVSPDGTLAAARAENDDTAMPGDVLIVGLEDGTPLVRVPAVQWSSVSWQPVVNAANPATSAPAGLPTP